MLRPASSIQHLHFWSTVYLPESTSTSEERPAGGPGAETHHPVLTKTRSCDDIVAVLEHTVNLTRTSSDPNLVELHRSFLPNLTDSSVQNSAEIANKSAPSLMVHVSNAGNENRIVCYANQARKDNLDSNEADDGTQEGEATTLPNGDLSDGESTSEQSQLCNGQHTVEQSVESSTDTLVQDTSQLAHVTATQLGSEQCKTYSSVPNDKICKSEPMPTGGSQSAENGFVAKLNEANGSNRARLGLTVNTDCTVPCPTCPFIVGTCEQVHSRKPVTGKQCRTSHTSGSSAASAESSPNQWMTPGSSYPTSPVIAPIDPVLHRSMSSLLRQLDHDGLPVVKDLVQQQLRRQQAESMVSTSVVMVTESKVFSKVLHSLCTTHCRCWFVFSLYQIVRVFSSAESETGNRFSVMQPESIIVPAPFYNTMPLLKN